MRRFIVKYRREILVVGLVLIVNFSHYVLEGWLCCDKEISLSRYDYQQSDFYKCERRLGIANLLRQNGYALRKIFVLDKLSRENLNEYERISRELAKKDTPEYRFAEALIEFFKSTPEHKLATAILTDSQLHCGDFRKEIEKFANVFTNDDGMLTYELKDCCKQ